MGQGQSQGPGPNTNPSLPPSTKYKKNKCSPAKVKSCLRTFLAHLFSHVGLCVLIVGYAILGALMFEYYESKYEVEQRVNLERDWDRNLTQIRNRYVQGFWNITGKWSLTFSLLINSHNL